MKVTIDIKGSLSELMKDETRRMGLGLTAATRHAAEELKHAWRRQVVSAKLGRRLANSIRVADHPRLGFSYSPASEVYANAEQIIEAFEYGSVIRAKDGVWLAIPTAEAGVGKAGSRITPQEWERRRGRPLRMVVTSSGKAFLVADDARINKKGLAVGKGGKRRRDGILRGAQSIVIFQLVRQVRLQKRLSLASETDRIAARLPLYAVKSWNTP